MDEATAMVLWGLKGLMAVTATLAIGGLYASLVTRPSEPEHEPELEAGASPPPAFLLLVFTTAALILACVTFPTNPVRTTHESQSEQPPEENVSWVVGESRIGGSSSLVHHPPS